MFLYLDNAATSFPKPAEVIRAARRAAGLPLGNPGRSGHALARASEEIVYRARLAVARLLKTDAPEEVAFCGGATAALNLAIKGSAAALFRGAPLTVATSVYEHNSVLRPLYDLEREGRIRIFFYRPVRNTAEECLALLPKDTALAVFTLMNNVTGFTFPLSDLAKGLKARKIPWIADASQALGAVPVDLPALGADLICAPAHKGLLGVMGAGFLARDPKSSLLPAPLLSGGSGTASFEKEMPALLPERLEAGTLPVPALAALTAGIGFLLDHGVEEVAGRERALKKELAEGAACLPGVRLFGAEYPLGPLSLTVEGRDPHELAEALEKEGVLVRAGIHCAPLTHETLGTAPKGAVRFSFGPLSRKDASAAALKALARAAAKGRRPQDPRKRANEE